MSEELAVQPRQLVVVKTEEESMQRFVPEELLAESDALDVRSQAGFIKATVHLKRIKDAQSGYEQWFKKDPNGVYYNAYQTYQQELDTFNRVYARLTELRKRVERAMQIWQLDQERKERERIAKEAEETRQREIAAAKERLAQAQRKAHEAAEHARTKAQLEEVSRDQKRAILEAEAATKQAEAKAAYLKSESSFAARSITASTVKAPGTSITPKWEAVIENPQLLLEHVVAGKLPVSAIINDKVKAAMESCLNPLAKAFDGRNAPPGVRFEPKTTFVSRG